MYSHLITSTFTTHRFLLLVQRSSESLVLNYLVESVDAVVVLVQA